MLCKAKAAVLFVCVLALLQGAAHAAPLTGVLNITGDVAVGATTIDWLPAGGGSGALTVGASSTGSFAGLIGQGGSALDLDVTVQPVGSPFSLANFITLPGGITFTLTNIDPGVYPAGQCADPPAAGQSCTPSLPPPSSPFNLSNTAGGSTASFTVRGMALDNGTPVASFVGIYTTQFTGQSYQELLAAISGGGTVNASYSANFVLSENPVPEPATVFLALGGFLLAVGALRHRLVRR